MQRVIRSSRGARLKQLMRARQSRNLLRAGLVCGFISASIATPMSAQAGATVVSDVPQFSTPIAQKDSRKNLPVVTLTVRDSSVSYVIKALAKQAGLRVFYNDSYQGFAKQISVNIKNVPFLDAMAVALRGTGLTAAMTSDGGTVMVRPHSEQDKNNSNVNVVTGTVAGRVTDSASGRGLSGVTVVMRGANLSRVTNGNGEFALAGVPAGDQTIEFKLVGYRAVTRSVRVVDDQTVMVNVVLRSAPTMLSEVVTTATGQQQKREVGYTVPTINVDSLMKIAPVQSVTDILEVSRIPGMTVQRTSGTPGDPARIRLRGSGSPLENNDPVIIVDGIRRYSSQSDERNIRSGRTDEVPRRIYATTSPIDQIDPNTIDKIEILKGPVATALYGPDAASGAIVITTKRGQMGAPTWNFTIESGISQLRAKWPTSRYQWVTPLIGGLPALCVGFCGDAQIDSVINFQALNHPDLTPIGDGSSFSPRVEHSGGSGYIRYNLGASSLRSRGLLQLPKVEEARYLKFEGKPAPGWMRRPDLLERRGVTGRIDIDLSQNKQNKQTMLYASTAITQDVQNRSSLSPSGIGSAIGVLQQSYIDMSQLGDRAILGNPYERVRNTKVTMANHVGLNVTPIWWFPITTDVGWNTITENGSSTIAPGLPIPVVRNNTTVMDSAGSWLGEAKVNSDLNASMLVSIPRIMRVETLLKFEYYRERWEDQRGGFFGIPQQINNPGGGLDSTRNQFRRNSGEKVTFGYLLAPRLKISDRFNINPGFRLDANGLSGNLAKLSGLPQTNLSWVISEESFFPWKEAVPELRLRTGFGVAGNQPTQGDLRRLYGSLVGIGTDPLYSNQLDLLNIGNTRLRPERVSELDWGFDVTALQGRMTLNFSHWMKWTKDAIVSNTIAGSVDGGNQVLRMNVGDLTYSGVEATLQASPIERKNLGLSFTLNFARQTSLVRRLTDDGKSVAVGGQNSYVVGYPVAGVFMKPIAGYADLDNNGWISASELIVGSQPVFVGSQDPALTLGFSPSLTLLRRVTVTAGLSYVGGQLQVLRITSGAGGIADGQIPAFSNVVFGTDGFDRQAALVANFAGSTDIGYTQKVDETRLDFISLSTDLGTKVARTLKAKTATITLKGSNIALWTNYIGVDPNVNTAIGNQGLADAGQLPKPRDWLLMIRVRY